ncbi:phage integrase family protein [Luminiphilus syltensis NOR5-1B]|uniref:Phage integrase family protein n=1 Tax=Luminiphilus syltensis NOR5-1B TaxID=565045 RepID=B8KV17_9GAMM|nr:tyrosine-type recombinase/integrase [Luminiphilus syltensis]EED35888.1 phage integrase family protein [Luminiphilus syltensis NOR5-1B]
MPITHLDGAFADNTLRAYRADFQVFHCWCQANNIDQLAATPKDLTAFVEHEATQRSTATVRRRIASLSSLLKLNHYEDPSSAPEGSLALKRMHRQKRQVQQQAVPLTSDLLERLLAVCGDSLQGTRDQVMLRLGHESMRRRSELCAFRFKDLEVLPKGKRALRLRFSKTDQFGNGKLFPVSDELVYAIEGGGEKIGRYGKILRGIRRDGRINTSMSPASINIRLKALQNAAALTLDGELSGHSFRVGAALDLLESGESLEKIMLRGGWASDATAMRYLRAWQAV